MSLEKVKEYFKQYNIERRIKELDETSATCFLAAKALGTEENRIAKSMGFLVKDTPIIIVTSGDMKIDNSKYKHLFSVKAKMLTADELIKFIGHPAGGVCPFAVKENVKIYLDISLQRFETVFPACGSINSAIELTIPELEKYSHFEKWIDVCKGKE